MNPSDDTDWASYAAGVCAVFGRHRLPSMKLGADLLETSTLLKRESFALRGFSILCLFVPVPAFLFAIFGMETTGLHLLFVPALFLLIALVTALQSLNRDTISNKLLVRTACVLLPLNLMLQIAAAYFLAVYPAWDFGAVFLSAYEFVTKGEFLSYPVYFYRYPHNRGSLLLLYTLFQIPHRLGLRTLDRFLAWGIGFNLAAIQLANLLMLLFCKKTWGNRVALLYLYASVFFLPNILYGAIVYTDTLSMPFVAAVLLLFCLYLRSDTRPRRIFCLLLLSLVSFWGIQIKATVGIVLIAILLYALFSFPFRRFLAVLLLTLLPFLPLQLGHRQALTPFHFSQEAQHDYQYPAEYWLYVGLKWDGNANDADYNYVQEIHNYDARKTALQQGIQHRIKDYGLWGMAAHFIKKSVFTYGDGSYYAPEKLSREPLRRTSLGDFIYGDCSEIFDFLTTGGQLLLLSLLILGFLSALRDKVLSAKSLLNLILFGLVLFLAIWETRSRYLLNYSPVMLALAAKNLTDLVDAIVNRAGKYILPDEQAPASAHVSDPHFFR